MCVYPEGDDTWLFGGIFEVTGRKHPDEDGDDGGYDVELTNKGKEYIGRLKINYHNSDRQQYRHLENVYEKLQFSEILRAPYTGTPFCGYEKHQPKLSRT